MLRHTKELEKRSNKDRTDYVKKQLQRLKVNYEIQSFKHKILRGENIIVTEFCDDDKNQLLLTAHTNKYFSSPGANDNASGVAVLLKIIGNLKRLNLKKTNQVKIVFFDHEDGLAYLDGSTYFANHNNLTHINFVLNLDGVGMGNSFTVSPEITNETKNAYKIHLLKLFRESEIKFHSFNLPPLMIEDHIPFITKGVSAVSLNLMSKQDMNYLVRMEKKSFITKFAIYLFYRGIFSKKHPMAIMRHRHNELDTSEYIDISSLELCERITMQMVDFHMCSTS